MSKEELQAQDLVQRGEIDQAIATYRQLKPESARILRIIGVLYDEKIGDYSLAINYYEKALQIRDLQNHFFLVPVPV
jgi:tetratricopeptide (TPR) repeat protein